MTAQNVDFATQPLPTTALESRQVFPALRGIVRNNLAAVLAHQDDALVAALDHRESIGIDAYGKALESHNGRDVVRDAMEEALDLCAYLTQGYLEGKLDVSLVHQAIDLAARLIAEVQ